MFEDADIESATNSQVSAIFAASGQSCVAGSRLIIQRSIKDAFIERLKHTAQNVIVDDPSDMRTEVGPLCTLKQRNWINEVVESTIDAGAKLVAGGANINRPGFFFQPTILDCSEHPDAPSVRKELFGPVLSVLTFDTEEEAVEMANDTEYGLAAGVFTRNLAKAHRMINQINAGVVWVNSYRAVSPIVPFGGHGLSGYGREGGIEAALEYTKVKSVWLNTSEATIPDPFLMR